MTRRGSGQSPRSTPAHTALFVYGTLMADECVFAVTGRRFRRQPAVLEGYARITPPGAYPYIVRQAGSSVDGSVLFEIDPASLEGLDRYEDEGRLYVRTPVEARCGDERTACDTYVGNVSERPATAGRESRRSGTSIRSP
jgi:gamma-glutamylcyclotransferase (GGCT)/AIG2-like uncharacterized protein YtfP